MKFTPGQVQETLQLSPATFRHWKTALPPLVGRNGYAPCFTPGDLLAMAIVKTLTENLGVKIGNLYGIAPALFDHCGRHSWVGLERSVLLIDTLNSSVGTIPETQPLTQHTLAIIVPLRPLIGDLQERLLLGQQEPDQEALRFPPKAVATKRQGGGLS